MPNHTHSPRPSSSTNINSDLTDDLKAPSLTRRMACWLYEGLLLCAVAFVAVWIFSPLAQMRDAAGSHRPFLMLFLFVIFGIYFVWFWSKGQTLAMKTWNIKITNRQGQAISQGRACVRYLWGWVWFLPPLAAVAPFNLKPNEISVILIGWIVIWLTLSKLQPQRQFWHDVFAGTQLVSCPPLTTKK